MDSDSDEWTFECKVCGETIPANSEVEALGHADDHRDYGLGGYFDFRIISPDGEVTHGAD